MCRSRNNTLSLVCQERARCSFVAQPNGPASTVSTHNLFMRCRLRLAVAMAPRWLAIFPDNCRTRAAPCREKDMMFRSILVTVITASCLCTMSTIAAAQDPVDPPTLKVRMTAPAGGDWQPGVTLNTATRGPALPGLYASLIGLQAYDGYSTSRGLKQGAVEANTFMSHIASHPGALWAAK